MLTVRVSKNRVRIDVDRRRRRKKQNAPSTPITTGSGQPSTEVAPSAALQLIEPEIADAITLWSLGRRGGLAAAMMTSGGISKEPFSARVREIEIHEDRILLCGLEVWRDCSTTHLRDALAMLSRRNAHGFIRVRGTQLTRDLGRDSTNHIGKPLADFCARASQVLESHGMSCGRDEVLQNSGGGYHFRDWIIVKIVGTWAAPLLHSRDEETKAESAKLNERQKWVMAQIDRGLPLQQKDVIFHFRSQWNASTIKRDLKHLRESGLITTGASGGYLRVSAARLA